MIDSAGQRRGLHDATNDQAHAERVRRMPAGAPHAKSGCHPRSKSSMRVLTMAVKLSRRSCQNLASQKEWRPR